MAFDHELLAIYLAIKHFRYFLEGRSFTVRTDHKPLVFALNSSVDRTPRQSRHLSYIAEFTSDIQHISGVDNVVADTLSRPPAAAISAAALPSGLDFAALAAAQSLEDATDTTLQIRRLE